MQYDYASILLNGYCSGKCPFCVGKSHPCSINNMKDFPLPGVVEFAEKVKEYNIPYLSISGIRGEPLDYDCLQEISWFFKVHNPKLIQCLHTYGSHMPEYDVLRYFDKITLSFPSFRRSTYHYTMDRYPPPFILGFIEEQPEITKLSMILDHETGTEDHMLDYFEKCKKYNIDRVVIRRKFEEPILPIGIIDDMTPVRYYHKQPVYNYNGIEVTVWNFEVSTIKGFYLYPDGTYGDNYFGYER